MIHQLTHAYANAIKCEHRDLAALAHRLQMAVTEATSKGWPEPAAKDIVDHLQQLENCLANHFAREEEGGFLEEATAGAPRFGHEVERLLEEHKELLADVRMLVAMGRKHCASATQTATAWDSFGTKLTATIKQLLNHETRENSLLQHAFNVELDF